MKTKSGTISTIWHLFLIASLFAVILHLQAIQTASISCLDIFLDMLSFGSDCFAQFTLLFFLIVPFIFPQPSCKPGSESKRLSESSNVKCFCTHIQMLSSVSKLFHDRNLIVVRMCCILFSRTTFFLTLTSSYNFPEKR